MLGKNKKNQTDDELIDAGLDDLDASEQLNLVKEILENTQANIKKALSMLKEKDIDTKALLESLKDTREATKGLNVTQMGSERIIEGVFNGEKMVGGDGIEYAVPANYASKSKLVEGDILKLTIRKDGSFIYKQIGPVERMQLVGTLVQSDTNGEWYAVDDDERWKLLTASVTYFHGSPGDEVVILIPKGSSSKWAAVENVIRGS